MIGLCTFIHNERQSAFHYALGRRWERLEESKRVSKRGTRLILHPNKPVLAAAINTPRGALFAPIGRPHPYALKLTARNTQPAVFTWPERDEWSTLFPTLVSFSFPSSIRPAFHGYLYLCIIFIKNEYTYIYFYVALGWNIDALYSYYII